MRIATFNILHGRSPDDGQVDVDRLAAAVKSLDADVLGLQEVDRDQPRSLGADLTAVAAEAMGAADTSSSRRSPGTPGGTWMAATGEEQPGSADYGIALLSRLPGDLLAGGPAAGAAGERADVVQRDRAARSWVSDEPRVAVAAVLDGPFGEFTVCNTHLSFIPGWSALQLRRLVRSLDRHPGAAGAHRRPEHGAAARRRGSAACARSRSAADLPGAPARAGSSTTCWCAAGSGRPARREAVAAAAVGPPGARRPLRAVLTARTDADRRSQVDHDAHGKHRFRPRLLAPRDDRPGRVLGHRRADRDPRGVRALRGQPGQPAGARSPRAGGTRSAGSPRTCSPRRTRRSPRPSTTGSPR